MKSKNFLVSGVVGGIAAFFLGYLIWGILFKDFFPQPEESTNNLVMIFFGSLCYGLLLSYIFVKWAQVSTAVGGAKAGAALGLLLALYFDFFQLAMNPEATYQMFALDVVLSIVFAAIIGAIIGTVNGKLG